MAAKINFSGLWAVGISYVCRFLHSLNVSFWTFKFLAQWISQQAQRSPIQGWKTRDPLNRDKNEHLFTAVMTRCVVGGRYQDFMPEKSKVSHRGCPPDTVSSLLQTHTLLPIPVWGTSQVFHFYSSCYATSAYQTQWLKCTELQMAFLLQKTSELLCCIRLRYKDPEGSAFDKVNLRVNAAPCAKTIYCTFFFC